MKSPHQNSAEQTLTSHDSGFSRQSGSDASVPLSEITPSIPTVLSPSLSNSDRQSPADDNAPVPSINDILAANLLFDANITENAYQHCLYLDSGNNTADNTPIDAPTQHEQGEEAVPSQPQKKTINNKRKRNTDKNSKAAKKIEKIPKVPNTKKAKIEHSCEICEEKFNTKRDLDQHKENHKEKHEPRRVDSYRLFTRELRGDGPLNSTQFELN